MSGPAGSSITGATNSGARFRLDPSYRRARNASVIIAGSPLRLFRLSAAGRRVAEAVERGGDLPPGHEALTDRLYDAGAIHRVAGATTDGSLGIAAADVTVVTPVYSIRPLVVTAQHGAARTVVVDDASPTPIKTDGPGVELLVRTRNGGPAAARNTGLAEVATAFGAFVDTDVEVPAGWLEAMVHHFADPRVGLVAPRVRSAAGGSALVDQYEAVHGSLDLGPQQGRVAPGSRIGYVPGTVVVCRTEAIRAVGGFDEALRYGEDVDLVWRLHEAGWRCRYEPVVEVHHTARPTMRAWLEQRYRYGTSAAPLEERHPRALAPLRISGWSAAVWGLLLCRRPGFAAVVAVGTGVALRRKLHDVPPAETARLAGLGHLLAGEQIAVALRRAWWPLAIVGSVTVRRIRPWLAAAALVPGIAEWWRGRRRAADRNGAAVPTPLLAFVAMRLADDVAYGAGLWAGCLRARSLAALRPDLANWPPRRPTTVTAQ